MCSYRKIQLVATGLSALAVPFLAYQQYLVRGGFFIGGELLVPLLVFYVLEVVRLAIVTAIELIEMYLMHKMMKEDVENE